MAEALPIYIGVSFTFYYSTNPHLVWDHHHSTTKISVSTTLQVFISQVMFKYKGVGYYS